MCGFAGVLSFEGQVHDHLASVRELTQLAERRGPDDEGYWNDDHLAVGFRRLAILDLSPAGHQPMQSSGGRSVIVYNGELFNQADLRRELTARGVRFRSTCDTEVVLAALDAWGTEALDRFNGMYAFAYYDRRSHRLLLARDHLGIKPLYYLRADQGIVFGSQYDQVLGHPWARERSIRGDVLSLYLRFGYVPAPFGLVADTHQVEPGAWVSWGRDGRQAEARYWSFAPEEGGLGGSELDRVMDSTLERVIERQLAADVPVGTFLSGGVDSPLVTAIAHRVRPALPAFTVGTNSAELDESADATAYAEAIGCDHVLRMITGIDAASMLDDVVRAYSEPFADYSAFPTLLVSGIAREQVEVMLSGDGGDELFWGYPRMWTLIEQRRFLRLPQAARRLLWRAPGTTRPWGSTLFATPGEWYAHKHGPVEMASLAPGLEAPPGAFDVYDDADLSSDAAVAQWVRTAEMRGHLEKMLIKVDRASMYHSLEVRVPLLDVEMTAIAARADPSACMQPGLGKLPLRRALAAELGGRRVSTAKKGFTVPLGDWLRHDLRSVFEERVLDEPCLAPEVWDRSRIASMWTRHLAGEVDYSGQLWTLLSLQLWADTHLLGPFWKPPRRGAGQTQASNDSSSE